MTKMLKIAGVALGAVLATGVVLALVAPQRIAVTNKQFIKAPAHIVYDQLRFMKQFPTWSPFLVQDPQQKFAVSGNDGQIGATYSWEGVKEKSKGLQKVVALSANNRVTIQCHITEPFQSAPVFNYTLTEKDGGVELVQQFDTKMPVPSNIIGLLLGLKGKIAATNQQGLALLKQTCEAKTNSGNNLVTINQ